MTSLVAVVVRIVAAMVVAAITVVAIVVALLATASGFYAEAGLAQLREDLRDTIRESNTQVIQLAERFVASRAGVGGLGLRQRDPGRRVSVRLLRFLPLSRRRRRYWGRWFRERVAEVVRVGFGQVMVRGGKGWHLVPREVRARAEERLLLVKADLTAADTSWWLLLKPVGAGTGIVTNALVNVVLLSEEIVEGLPGT